MLQGSCAVFLCLLAPPLSVAGHISSVVGAQYPSTPGQETGPWDTS